MGMMHILSIAAGLAVPLSAGAEPSYHRVIGVAANDVLNIRSAPNADSADIGDLAHDARGIEVLAFDVTGQWARIALAETDGWVAARFLGDDAVATIGESSIPVGIACGGTEPFWGLTLGEGDEVFRHPEAGDTPFETREVRVAEGRVGNPALMSLHSGADRSIDAMLLGAACSDGMSDRSYGWTITLRLSAPGQDRFLTGCCHLPRD